MRQIGNNVIWKEISFPVEWLFVSMTHSHIEEHNYIEEHNIADCYLLGKLSAEERRRFERHLENCRQCIDQLRTIDDLRTGLRIVATEDLLHSPAKAEARFLSKIMRAGIMRVGRTNQVPLLVSAILLIALPTGLAVLKWRDTHRNLGRAVQTDTESRRTNEVEGEVAPNPSKEMVTPNLQESAPRDRIAQQSKSERKSHPSPSSLAEQATSYRSVVPVYTLSTTRSRGFGLSEPVNRIELSPSHKSIILLLELESDQDIQSYRAAISAADGRDIWRECQLKPGSSAVLTLRFESNLFKQGNYLLRLEGFNTQDRYVLIARYPFSVVTQ
jgi:putative zinc finger protein